MKQTLQEKIDACFSPHAAYATGGLWRIGEEEDYLMEGYTTFTISGSLALTREAWDDFITDYSVMFLPRVSRPAKRKSEATVTDGFGNILAKKSHVVSMRLCPWVNMVGGADELTVSLRPVYLRAGQPFGSFQAKSVLQPWCVLTMAYITRDGGTVSAPAYWQPPASLDDDKKAMLRGIVYLVRGVSAMLQAGNTTLRGRSTMLDFIDRCLGMAVSEHRSDHLQRLIDAAKAAEEQQRQEFWDRLAPRPRRFLKKGKK